MKFFKKKMVASLALAGAMAMLASPLVSTVEASGLYSVRQGNTTIGAYESREVAIREARKWANSRVIQNGNTVWTFGTNDNVYRVFQGNTNLGAYASRDVAIREARKWSGSRVVQNGSTVWTFGSNDNLYRVVQGNTTIGAYASRDVAIREARKWSNSRVTQNGNTVWTFQASTNNLYSVRQGNTTIGAYASRDVAIREALKWNNSNISYRGNTVWNYPRTIKLSDTPRLRVSGKLSYHRFDNKETSGMVTYGFILDLDEPFYCIITDFHDDRDYRIYIDSIHVASTNSSRREGLKKYIGKNVTVEGSTMAAHTGYHKRPILLFI